MFIFGAALPINEPVNSHGVAEIALSIHVYVQSAITAAIATTLFQVVILFMSVANYQVRVK